MKRHVSIFLAVFVGLTVMGCGGGGGGNNTNENTNENTNQNTNENTNQNVSVLGDLDGFYELTSVVIPGEPSDATFTRIESTVTLDGTDYQGMVRGYSKMSATNATTGTADLGFGLMLDRVPWVFNINPNTTVSLEASANKLVLGFGPPIGSIVYLFALDGDVLTLTIDPNDVRNTDVLGHAANEIVFTRSAEYAHELVGSYEYVSFTVDPPSDDPFTMSSTCGPRGDDWARISGTVHVTSLGGLRGQMLQLTYDNDLCQGTPDDTWALEFEGFCDVDETSNEIVFFMMANDTNGYGQYFSYTLSGQTLTMDVTAMYGAGGGEWLKQTVLEKL